MMRNLSLILYPLLLNVVLAPLAVQAQEPFHQITPTSSELNVSAHTSANDDSNQSNDLPIEFSTESYGIEVDAYALGQPPFDRIGFRAFASTTYRQPPGAVNFPIVSTGASVEAPILVGNANASSQFSFTVNEDSWWLVENNGPSRTSTLNLDVTSTVATTLNGADIGSRSVKNGNPLIMRISAGQRITLGATASIESLRTDSFAGGVFYTAGGSIRAYEVLGPTCSQVVEGAVKVKLFNKTGVEVNKGSAEAVSIKAEFVPNFGLTLQEAADFCDCDGFNWLNHMDFPKGWRVWQVEGGAFDDPFSYLELAEDGTGTLTSNNPTHTVRQIVGKGLVDPIINGDQNMYAVTYQFGVTDSWFFGWFDHDGSDSEPYYYDVDEGPIFGSSLVFYDAPSMGDPAYQEGEFTQFHTSLVGIKKDGPDVVWSDIRTNFDWKSNRTHEDGGIFYSSTLEGTAPPYFRGGIFDVLVDGVVPEPSSVVLLIVASIVGLPCGRRRSSLTWRKGVAKRGHSTPVRHAICAYPV